MIDQDIVHDKAFSPLSSERIEAMEQLCASFESLPDREQAFEDMLKLSSDKYDEVRESAVSALSTVCLIVFLVFSSIGRFVRYQRREARS